MFIAVRVNDAENLPAEIGSRREARPILRTGDSASSAETLYRWSRSFNPVLDGEKKKTNETVKACPDTKLKILLQACLGREGSPKSV